MRALPPPRVDGWVGGGEKGLVCVFGPSFMDFGWPVVSNNRLKMWHDRDRRGACGVSSTETEHPVQVHPACSMSMRAERIGPQLSTRDAVLTLTRGI